MLISLIDTAINVFVFCVILSCHCVNKIVDINQIMMSPCLVSRSATTKKKTEKNPHPKSEWKLNCKQHYYHCLWWIYSVLMIFCSDHVPVLFFLNYSDINNWIKFQIVSLCNNDAYPTCNKYHLSFLRFCFIKIKKNKNFFSFSFGESCLEVWMDSDKK